VFLINRLIYDSMIWVFFEFINSGKIHVDIFCISTYNFIMFLLLSIRFFLVYI